MTDPSAAPSDALARAAAAESRAVTAEAQLGVTQNERDAAVKTAEAAEAGLTQAVGERDTLARKNEDLTREAGRQQGVNEVLKEELQKAQQAPPAPVIDLTPVVDALARVEGSITNKFDATANSLNGLRDDLSKVAVQLNAPPVLAPAPVTPAVKRRFWQREGEAGKGIIRMILWIIGWVFIILVLSALLYVFWNPLSGWVTGFYNSFTHHEETTAPSGYPPPERIMVCGPGYHYGNPTVGCVGDTITDISSQESN